MSFERFKKPLGAYNVACALARLARPDEAMAWLHRASEAGFAQVELALNDQDLVSLRERDDYRDWFDALKAGKS